MQTSETLLVTGGAGFIGSSLVRLWLGHPPSRNQPQRKCVVLDKLTYAASWDALASVTQHPGLVRVVGDVLDQALVRRLLEEHRIEAIVHLAAESHVDRSIDDPAPFLSTNIVGTGQVLEAALGYWAALAADRRAQFRVLHVSTDEVYGSTPPPDVVTEGAVYRPSSPYAASKAAADHLVSAYFRTYGLPCVIAHGTNNFGPFQFPEKLIPLMITLALGGQRLPLYGDGGHQRDWLFVDDFSRGLVQALRDGRPGECYHFASGTTRTNREVVLELGGQLQELGGIQADVDFADWICHVQDRPGHDQRYALDSSKARRELSWNPEVSWSQGLRQTVLWYLQNRAWVARMTGRYDGRRLGRRGGQPGRDRDAPAPSCRPH